ncbi:MAG: hypothetical protein KDA93_17125 [Planctomycetaceae bacterium]|nr:hypothetical protein [Planctomycetaceae bacterium]
MAARVPQFFIITMLAVTLLAANVQADDAEDLKRIDAENAAAHAGEHVVVTMTVNASRLLRDRDIGFLNSHKDYMHEDNFTVVFYEKVLKEFADQDIDDPCKHYRGKKIEVTGGIELRRGKPQIVLKSPKDIKIVKEDAGESGDDA